MFYFGEFFGACFTSADAKRHAPHEDDAADVALRRNSCATYVFGKSPPFGLGELLAEGIADRFIVSGAVDGGLLGGGNSDDLRRRDFPHQRIELGQLFGIFRVAVVDDKDVSGLERCRGGEARNDQGKKKEDSHYLRRLRLRRSYASETFGEREAETSSRLISWER